MSEMAGEDWRGAIDDVDAELIDGYQSGFPVEELPFRAVGESLGVPADEALARVERLCDLGIVRRFGAVLNPPMIGASTLAALQVPEDRFGDVAETVNAYRQVNHNYRRDHDWNMWFVVTAGSLEERDRILAEVEAHTGLSVLELPMLTDFYVDLEFPVVNADRLARERSDGTEVSATPVPEGAATDLSTLDRRLLGQVQAGFPLSATPYRDVAAALGVDPADVVTTIDRLLADGYVKRVGCVVDHVLTGFDANCMVVWDVPDADLEVCGRRVGGLPYVTLCYHRPRRPEQGWPYNLFTMIHGRDGSAVDATVDELAREHLPFDHARLYSTETLKQTGARYEEIVGVGADA